MRFSRQSRGAGILACCIADFPVGGARRRREQRVSTSPRTIRADTGSKPAMKQTESLRCSTSCFDSGKASGPDPNTNI